MKENRILHFCPQKSDSYFVLFNRIAQLTCRFSTSITKCNWKKLKINKNFHQDVFSSNS